MISKAQLTEHLYAQDHDRDSNVLEVFVRRLRQKLDPDQSLNPIETVRAKAIALISSWSLKVVVQRSSGVQASRGTRYSLRARMLLVLSAVLLLFLGFTGVALDRAYRNSVEAGAAERLQVQVYLLLAALEQEAGEFFVIEDIQDPRYASINSGLYGFVYDAAFVEMWRSDSALTLSIASRGQQAQPMPGVGESVFETVRNTAGEQLFASATGFYGKELRVLLV